MKNGLPNSLIALAVVSATIPANAQSFSWDPNVEAVTYRPQVCFVSIRESREPDWTRGNCHEVALTQSNTSINIHFRTESGRGSHATITFVMPAESRGQRILPVIGVGLNTDGDRSSKETIGASTLKVNRCEVSWPSVTCNAVVQHGDKSWGFVATASLE